MREENKYTYRLAKSSDNLELEKLILLSAEKINSFYYPEEVMRAAIGKHWTLDEQLILDQTYWLAENEKNEIVGCGGWSKRKLLTGSDKMNNSSNSELIPGVDAAKIRAFFVHPNHTLRGIGFELLKICEEQAKLAAFTSLELIATLSGEKLYKKGGFSEVKRYKIELEKGVFGDAFFMRKSLVNK